METYNPCNDGIIIVDIPRYENILCEKVEIVKELEQTTMFNTRQKDIIELSLDIKKISNITFNKTTPVISSSYTDIDDIEYYETCKALSIHDLPDKIINVEDYTHTYIEDWMLINKYKAKELENKTKEETILEITKHNSKILSENAIASCVKARLKKIESDMISDMLKELHMLSNNIRKINKVSRWKKLFSSEPPLEMPKSDPNEINNIPYEKYKLSEKELIEVKQNLLKLIGDDYGQMDLSAIENFKVEDQDSEEFKKKVENLKI